MITILTTTGYSKFPSNGDNTGVLKGFNPYYVTCYAVFDGIPGVNYLNYVGASAIIPSDSCTITRIHTTVLEITIQTTDTHGYYDLFVKYLDNGVLKEVKFADEEF